MAEMGKGAGQLDLFGSRAVGRPTSFRPEYCGQLISAMSQGMGFSEACAHVGVSNSAARSWRKKFPEFKKAMRDGRDAQRAWWERVGRLSVFNPNFNSVLFIYLTANFFGWRRTDEISKVETTSVNSTVHKHLHLKVQMKDLSNEQLRTLQDVRRLISPAT